MTGFFGSILSEIEAEVANSGITADLFKTVALQVLSEIIQGKSKAQIVLDVIKLFTTTQVTPA